MFLLILPSSSVHPNIYIYIYVCRHKYVFISLSYICTHVYRESEKEKERDRERGIEIYRERCGKDSYGNTTQGHNIQ